jgi:hypothetical protein
VVCAEERLRRCLSLGVPKACPANRSAGILRVREDDAYARRRDYDGEGVSARGATAACGRSFRFRSPALAAISKWRRNTKVLHSHSPEYHRTLFPEIAYQVPLPHFPQTYGLPQKDKRIPGNTIRKVYLSRSKTTLLHPGDILLLSMSNDIKYMRSQCLTTVGISRWRGIDTADGETLGLFCLGAPQHLWSSSRTIIRCHQQPTWAKA